MADLNLIHSEPIIEPRRARQWAREYADEHFDDELNQGAGTTALVSFLPLFRDEVPTDPWYGEPFDTSVPQTEAQLRRRKVRRATEEAINGSGPYHIREATSSYGGTIRYGGPRPIPDEHRHFPRHLIRDFLAWLKQACDEKAPDQ